MFDMKNSRAATGAGAGFWPAAEVACRDFSKDKGTDA